MVKILLRQIQGGGEERGEDTDVPLITENALENIIEQGSIKSFRHKWPPPYIGGWRLFYFRWKANIVKKAGGYGTMGRRSIEYRPPILETKPAPWTPYSVFPCVSGNQAKSSP
jgi:hypothetical protein